MRESHGNEDEEEARKSRSQIAEEICDLITTTKFINWYLVLRVDENADFECIKKQYHKLALQVHPDKNKDPKADTAFKLVSQAYLCLSDEAKRAAFDKQRHSTINNTTCRFHQRTRINRRIKEVQMKLKQEATIIQKCLAPKTLLRQSYNNARTETPVFNPSDYHKNGYPHYTPITYNMQDRKQMFR